MDNLRGLVVATVVSLLSLEASAGPSMADPPPGDTCDTAIPLVWGQDWQYAGDLTPCANDYDPAVLGPSCTGSAAPGQDVVFAMGLDCLMGLDVFMDPDNFDGALYIVTDCSDIAGSCVTGSDHEGVGVEESVILSPTISRTYYIIVDARDTGAGGPFNLSFAFLSGESWEGACCFPDGNCTIMEFDSCVMAGGVTLGPCSDCEPNPCAPTPSREESWGSIKARYR